MQMSDTVVSRRDLPPEIITEIVHLLVDERSIYEMPGDQIQSGKRGLAACSLVCRHWAGLLRPMLFRLLTLRNQGDVSLLFEFVRSSTPVPGPPLRECIHYICFEDYRDWTLSALNRLRAIAGATKPKSIALFVRNCRLRGKRRPTQHHLPFFSLPNSLPGRLAPITALHLTSVQLRRHSDLVRLLGSLSAVEACYLIEVTFREPSSPILRRSTRSTSHLQYLCMCQCDDGRIETQQQLASALFASQRGLRLDYDEPWSAYLQVMSAMLLHTDVYDRGEFGLSVFPGACHSYLMPNVSRYSELYRVGKPPAWYIVATNPFRTGAARVDASFQSNGEGELVLSWTGDVHQAFASSLDALNNLEAQLLSVEIIPDIRILGHRDAILWLLCRIFEGALERVIRSDKLVLVFLPFHVETNVHVRLSSADILLTPVMHTSEGGKVVLTPEQRAQWRLLASASPKVPSLQEEWEVFRQSLVSRADIQESSGSSVDQEQAS